MYSTPPPSTIVLGPNTSGGQSFKSKSYLAEGETWDDTDIDEEEQLGNVAFMANAESSSPPPAGSFQVDPTCPKLFMQIGLARDDARSKLKAATLKNNALVLDIPVSYTHLTLPTNREV